MIEIFLLLSFAESGKLVNVEEFGPDVSKAVEKYDAAIASGAADGVDRLVLISTGKLHKGVDVYSTAWHEDQRKASIAASQKSASDKLLVQIAELDPALAAKLQSDTQSAPTEERLAALNQTLVEAGLDPEKDLAGQLADLTTKKAQDSDQTSAGDQAAAKAKGKAKGAAAEDLLGGTQDGKPAGA